MDQLRRHTIAILTVVTFALVLLGVPAVAGSLPQEACATACPDCANPQSAACVACAGACLNAIPRSAAGFYTVSLEVALPLPASLALAGIDTAPPLPPPRQLTR